MAFVENKDPESSPKNLHTVAATRLAQLIKHEPRCADTLEVPLWAALVGAGPAVWLEAPVQVTSTPSPSGLQTNDEEDWKGKKGHVKRLTSPRVDMSLASGWFGSASRGDELRKDTDACFGPMMEALRLGGLPISFHKAYRASRDIIW
jgi:hypothetical protein